MIKIVGLILLIYGGAGVIATFFVYRGLRSPLDKLRELLGKLAEKVEQGGNSATRASEVIAKTAPIFEKIAKLLAQIVSVLRRIASGFGEASDLLKGVDSTLRTVEVPAIVPQTKTLALTFGFPVVTSVKLEEYEVVGVKVYGPPVTLTTKHLGLELGNVTVVSGLNLSHAKPLVPVGQAFGSAGGNLQTVQQQFDDTGNHFDEARERALETKEAAVKTSERIQGLADKLEEASQDLSEMSQSRLLALIPVLVLGYWGFMHLAFALTGLALLRI